MTDDKATKIGCSKCRHLHRGRLLPVRKGWLKCNCCAHQTPDQWGLTDKMSQGDFASMAEFARQLRATKKKQEGCSHPSVIVSLRPWCPVCSKPLDPDHPLHAAAIRKLEAMQADAPPLGQQLKLVGKAIT